MTDPTSTADLRCGIATSVAADVLGRADIGRAKYGVTLERTDLTRAQWLQHAYEEALDLAALCSKHTNPGFNGLA